MSENDSNTNLKDDQEYHLLAMYRKLSEDQKNHELMLKDQTVVLYAATLLEHDNIIYVKICLEILSNFVQNSKTHSALMCIFGVYEALETLSIRLRQNAKDSYSPALEESVNILINILRASAPPAFSTRQRTKGNGPDKTVKKTSSVFVIYFRDLLPENRLSLDEALVQIKGVVSFVVDLEMKKCTVRVSPRLNIRKLISKINLICGLNGLIAVRRAGQEEYIDIFCEGDKLLDKSYEVVQDSCFDSPLAKGFSLANNGDVKRNSGGFLKSVTDFWNKNFYW